MGTIPQVMLKCLLLMKLKRKLTNKQFIISHLLILATGLVFLFTLHYILNIQYQTPYKPFLAGPVTTAPKTLRLDLDHPEDMNLTFQSPILVSGKTNPLREVLIFTDSQDLVLTSKKDGSFSISLNLLEGENLITAVAFDSNGDFRSSERTVYYSKEKL